MSLRGRFMALTYDRLGAKVEEAGLRELRRDLLGGAQGRVVEIGGGTGANLPFYGPHVESLTVTEPEAPMLRRLEAKARESPAPVTLLRAPAEDLPFDEGSFDAAVSTLVLCGVRNQALALREVHRVLRPGGRLLFIEHVRSAEPGLARLQDRMNGLNRLFAGCECNRRTLDAIREAGFVVERLEHATMQKAPRFVSPLIVGEAGRR